MNKLQIDIHEQSLHGGREANEDACSHLILDKEQSCLVCVVADGLGGHRGGQIASKIAVNTILSYFENHQLESPSDLIFNSINNANQAILDKAQTDPYLTRMKTTCVFLYIKDNKAYWAHVGDSRLYHFRNNKIIFQTKDHSVVQFLLDTGEIKPEEVRGHPDRNRLIKTLGTDPLKIRSQTDGINVQAGDIFLLCSDGLWDLIEETEMENIINQNIDSTAEQICSKLVKTANEQGKGEYDNITAQVIRII